MFVIEKPPIAILLLLSALAPAALSLVSLLRQDEAWRKVSIGISLFGVGSLAAAILAAFVSALDAGALPSEIVRGWILPRQEGNALIVGLLVDTVGFSVVVYSCFVFSVFLLAQLRSERAHRSHSRTLVAAGFTLSGIGVAWLSVSLWLSLAGQVIAGAGAALFIAATPALPGADESPEVGNYLVERVAVLLLGVLGGCALLVSGHAPAWNVVSSAGISGTEVHDRVFVLGEILLLLSCWLSLLSPVRVFASARSRVRYSGIGVPIALLGPAVAAFAPVFRLQPLLARHPDLLGFFVILASVSLILIALHSVVLETAAKMILPLAAAAGLLPFFVLATGGVEGFVTLLFAWVAAISTWGVLSERLDGMLGSDSDRIRKALILVPALVLVGGPGFSTAGTLVDWLSELVARVQPQYLMVLLVAVAVLSFQIWTFAATAWSETRTDAQRKLGASDLIISGAVLLPAAGLAWTGTVSGGLIENDPDRFFGSLLAGIVEGARLGGDGAGSRINAATGVQAVIVGTWLSLQATLAGVAFWFAASGPRGRRAQLLKRFPKARDFLMNGLLIPAASRRGGLLLRNTGQKLHEAVTQVFWFKVISSVVARVSTTMSNAASRADGWMISRTTEAIRSGAEGTSGGLRRIQSGDVQWYVLFGVGGALLVLLTFFRIVKS